MPALSLDIHPLRPEELASFARDLPFREMAQHERRLSRQTRGDGVYLVAWERATPTPPRLVDDPTHQNDQAHDQDSDGANFGEWVAIGQGVVTWRPSATADDLAQRLGCPIVNDLFVHPARRSQGIGAALLAACEAAARAHGDSRIALGVGLENPRARTLYERHGYRTARLGELYTSGTGRDTQGQERSWEEIITYLVKSLIEPASPDTEGAADQTTEDSVASSSAALAGAESAPVAAYDEVAEWYDERIRDEALTHGLTLPAALDLIETEQLAGQRVCDLACGQGGVTRLLTRYGAVMTGVDIAGSLLALAERAEAEAPLGITYIRDDLCAPTQLADAQFDGALCHMALMDVADLGAAAHTVGRILKPGAWFVFVITHPAYQTPNSSWTITEDGNQYRMVADYFAVGFWRPPSQGSATSVRERVGAHHRTLGAYLNAFTAAGLTFERLLEPQIGAKLRERLLAANPPPARQALAWGGMEIPIALAARVRRR